MKELQKLLEIFRDFETIIHQEEFSQFTIDFIQNEEMHINKSLDCYNLTDVQIDDLIASYIYQIDNILDIIKNGKDCTLFYDLKSNIEKIIKS